MVNFRNVSAACLVYKLGVPKVQVGYALDASWMCLIVNFRRASPACLGCKLNMPTFCGAGQVCAIRGCFWCKSNMTKTNI